MGASVALYRKYRGKSFSDVLGQEHITKALENAIKTDRISHAYLFTGPRGVGKTSIARIIAHDVNGLEYDEAKNHIDIIEIDAASNRKIDEIRDLREKIHIAPVDAKYKVYIIDEVHMLTREAFNALLKTLEEPPAHAIFILATTEAHKVPSTIISRTQRHTFLPIPTAVAKKHLAKIAKSENISINEEALELLAEHGDGSFRDSISLLDLMAGTTDKKIDAEQVQSILGLPPQSEIENILNHISSGDSKQVFKSYQSLLEQGAAAAIIAKQLINVLRKQGTSDRQTIQFIQELLSVLSSPQQETLLEVLLLKQCLQNQTDAKSQSTTVVDAPTKNTKAEQVVRPSKKPTEQPTVEKNTNTKKPAEAETEAEPTDNTPVAKSSTNYKQLNDQERSDFLNNVKKNNNSLHAVVRVAVIERHNEEPTLRLSFRFPFHHKQTQQSKNAEQLRDAAQKTFSDISSVECIVDKELGAQNKVAPKTNAHSVLETFGGGEVIEI